MSRSGRVRSSQPLLQLAVALFVVWVGACADESVGSGSDGDRVLGASVALPAGPVPECEVLVEHHAASRSWLWRWRWDAASRMLRTDDDSWTLRYDEQGRLVEDIRLTDGFKAEYAYAALQGALSGRLVHRHGRLDETTSFTQQVTRLSNLNYVELSGKLSNEERRLERIEYTEAGLVQRFAEDGLVSVVRYRPDNQFDRAFRPNRSELSCTYHDDGAIKSCMEDGLFDPTGPQRGTARDGVPDAEWHFSPGCRAIQALASSAWFSLPNVAALPACLRNVPPWRSPAARCGAYAVSWVIHGPGRVSGRRTTAEQSEPIDCTESPCLAVAGDGFSLRTRDGRAAHFVCQEDRTGVVKEGPAEALELELGPIANNWNCVVTFEQPSTFEVTWKPERLSRVFVESELAGGERQFCERSPCHVKRGHYFFFGTPGEPARLACVERGTGREVKNKKPWFLEVESIQGDWDCEVTLDDPTPTHSVSWWSDLPTRVRWSKRAFEVPYSERWREWVPCEGNPCEVTHAGDFEFRAIGKRQPQLHCEPVVGALRLPEQDIPAGSVDLGATLWPFLLVSTSWTCSVTFGELPSHLVTWKVTSGAGTVVPRVRDLGTMETAGWGYCTDDSCLMREEDEFKLEASSSANFKCRSPGVADRTGQGPEFNLGPVDRAWDCDVWFGDRQPQTPPPPSLPQPTSPSPTPPPLRPPHTVTWEATRGLLLTVTGSPGSSCDETSCLVPTNGSVRFEALGRNVVFTCREIARWEPPFFANTSSSTGVLPNIQTNWRCWATINEAH